MPGPTLATRFVRLSLVEVGLRGDEQRVFLGKNSG
jgi:hypothetical protein